MLYVFAIVIGIAAGLAAGGKAANLLEFKLDKKWIILLAFIVQVISRVLSYKGIAFTVEYSFIIQGLSICMLLAAFWFNRKYIGIMVIGAGCFMNAAAILANDGKMPVSRVLAGSLVKDGNVLEKIIRDGKHVFAGAGTKLAFLSDIIYLPGFVGYGMKIVSAGDLVVVLGLFLLVLELVTNRKFGTGRKKMEGFN